MTGVRPSFAGVAALTVLSFSLGAHGQELRLGIEFQVNSFTASFQTEPSVAVEPDGDFVVVWASDAQDGASAGIFARRFSSTGAALASEFQVNAYTTAYQSAPAVATDADGDFVVAWAAPQDGSSGGVVARRFSSAGAALTSELQVNTYTSSSQRAASVAADAQGDFVVAWQSINQDGSDYGIFARRFSSSGAGLASEFQVNVYTQDDQFTVSVDAESDGDFILAWSSEQDGPGQSLGAFARRFSSAGAPLATEFQVNTYTPDGQYSPVVVANPGGDFVVAWVSFSQDGALAGVFGRRFSSSGIALAVEFQVNSYTADSQRGPSAAAKPNGDFTVAWHSTLEDGSARGVFARRFSSAGTPRAAEFQVNTYTPGEQTYPSLSLDANGRFVVAWISQDQDGSAPGVFAQRLAAGALDIDGNGVADPLTDGLLLLRYLFAFSGATLVNGALDVVNCTRCDAPTIAAHLDQIALPVSSAEETRVGSEFQVNTYTNSTQRRTAVAAGAASFVAAWNSDTQDGSGYGVFARPIPNGPPGVQINAYVTGAQADPAVAADDDGDFVVAWQSGHDGSELGVFARRFSSNGAALTNEFQVNTYTQSKQYGTTVAADADGDFVVVWYSFGQDGGSYGVFGRRFSSAGASLGGEFRVNALTLFGQYAPSIAMAADGDFVVAWHGDIEDGNGYGIFARRFSSAGAPLAGGDVQANTYTPNNQSRPSVAADAEGDFVVTWASFLQDGSGSGVFAQRFSSAGATLAKEFQVNTYTQSSQDTPSVASSAEGAFVVAWEGGTGQDGSVAGIFARRFSSAGTPLAREFQVNTYTTGAQRDPSVAVEGGRFIVAWHSNGQDGSSYGIFAQRFLAALIVIDIDGDGATQPLTDGLLALRYLFGFRGSGLVTGATAPGCTRCDAISIEAYIAGLIP